jgi:hypothetical protein
VGASESDSASLLGCAWGWSVAGCREPGPGSAAVAFLGEGEPALQLVGAVGEDVNLATLQAHWPLRGRLRRAWTAAGTPP